MPVGPGASQYAGQQAQLQPPQPLQGLQMGGLAANIGPGLAQSLQSLQQQQQGQVLDQHSAFFPPQQQQQQQLMQQQQPMQQQQQLMQQAPNQMPNQFLNQPQQVRSNGIK